MLVLKLVSRGKREFNYVGMICMSMFVYSVHGSTVPSLLCVEGETNHVLKVLITSRLSTSHPSGTEIF